MRKWMAAAVASFLLIACSQDEVAEAAYKPAAKAGAASAIPARARAEDDIRDFLQQEYPDAGPMRYALAWKDLDGDGGDEAIVHVVGPFVCGSGGCNTLVLAQAGSTWRKVGNISVSRAPITVLDSSSDGWRDLTVAIGGGGGEAGNALLRFDGQRYPSNPTVPPVVTTDMLGAEVLAEEPELIDLAESPSGG